VVTEIKMAAILLKTDMIYACTCCEKYYIVHRHDIAEILLKVASNTKNQSINYIVRKKKPRSYLFLSVNGMLSGWE
jgi:hypothetical protein